MHAKTGVVITTKPGIVKMTRAGSVGYEPSVKAPKGATLYILRSEREGSVKFWYRGKVYSDMLYVPRPNAPWKVISQPKTMWWVKVTNQRGVTGWVLNEAKFWSGADRCS